MAVFTEPTKWAQTLGKDADVVIIPDTAGETDPSIDKIFPSVFSIPLANGGRAIPRSVLNGFFKLLGDWIYYIQNGGIPTYNSSYDYVEGRIVLHTDNKPYFCIQANGALDPKAPSNTAYWSRIPTLSDFDEIGFNTGDIKIQTTATIPNGWLLCNGAGISRSTYSNLFTKIGTTFGTGDGSTTFNIPDLRDRYIIGANTNALGTKIAEQLPNIIGNAYFSNGIGVGSAHKILVSGNGAISTPAGGNGYSLSTASFSAGDSYDTLTFNANSSNSTYTNSGKVYPLSLALNFIIKS